MREKNAPKTEKNKLHIPSAQLKHRKVITEIDISTHIRLVVYRHQINMCDMFGSLSHNGAHWIDKSPIKKCLNSLGMQMRCCTDPQSLIIILSRTSLAYLTSSSPSHVADHCRPSHQHHHHHHQYHRLSLQLAIYTCCCMQLSAATKTRARAAPRSQSIDSTKK